MSTNIIRAIINIINSHNFSLGSFAKSSNRMNNNGIALEEYIKDAFSGTLNIKDEQRRLIELRKHFSYLGNQNNPPDVIIRNGDAIEIKKIENYTSALALNSSYPKAKLFNNKMLTKQCQDCEVWSEKDIIYVVGVCKKYNIHHLSFVYGVDYAASENIYTRIKDTIKNGINEIPDIELTETNELGKVKRVDPLGITSLRVRGMWHIENPISVFSYIYTRNPTSDFSLMAIINDEKYNSLPERYQLQTISKNNTNLKIKNVKIKLPDNPALLKCAKLISFHK